jgi:hypothetical protein
MRYLTLLACTVLLAASGALTLLLGPVSYEELLSLGKLLYLETAFAHLPLALTPDRYTGLHRLLFGTSGGSLLALIFLLAQASYRQEARRLGQEIRAAGRSLGQVFWLLTSREKAVAGGLLALIVAARAGLLLGYGFRYDELLSYQFFVREGPVAISSFYPLPNNHVFFNLCCAAFAPVFGQQPLLLMRLPSFVAAAVGTGLSYALLTRFTTFRVATLVTGLFNLTPAALYYAASGRGYYLQLVFIQLGFFAVVGLGCRPAYQRLGWLAFVLSSVLGLYTIPTYAYPLASLLLGAGLVQWPRPGQVLASWDPLLLATLLLATLLLATLLIGATAALLYAPVGAVSGWDRLLANSYVVPVSWAAFRGSALANVYEKTQELFGLVRPVLLVGGALLALVPVAVLRARLTPTQRSLAWVTWALLLMPMAVIMVQRTYPPTRAVVYLAYFGFLLAAVGWWIAAARWQWQPARRVQLALVVAVVVGAGALRAPEVLGRIRSSRHEEEQLTQAWQWLQTRHPQRVMLGSYEIFFYHYALRDHQRVVLANRPTPGRQYDYLILPPKEQLAPIWTKHQPYHAVFRNDLVSIFALSPPLNPAR